VLQDTFGKSLPYPGLLETGVFGTQPTPRMQIVPSDHYGVYANLSFGEPG
jgi:hypothetical protein